MSRPSLARHSHLGALITNLKLTESHLLVMGGLDLLLISGNAYLCLPSPLLQLILSKAKLNGVLILVNFLCAECGHADVNRDDDFNSISLFY